MSKSEGELKRRTQKFIDEEPDFYEDPDCYLFPLYDEAKKDWENMLKRIDERVPLANFLKDALYHSETEAWKKKWFGDE